MSSTSRTPSYSLHKPSCQAVVTLNGHDRYLTEYDSQESREKYDQEIAQRFQYGRMLPAGDDITINKLLVGDLAHGKECYPKTNSQ